MKRLGYLIAYVVVSLASVVFVTTATAVTLASYSKNDKTGSAVIKHLNSDDTVKR
jgi:hypothetical protein